MVTYCTNARLVLDSGQSIDDFMIISLSSIEMEAQKDKVREHVYEYINDTWLRERTALPATHISELVQIEIDLVVYEILVASFTGQRSNVSEWVTQYRDRSIKALEKVRFDASVESVIAGGENTGDGTVSITVKNQHTRTELWSLRAESSTEFAIHGDLHKSLPSYITVGTRYPEKTLTTGIGDYGMKKPRLNYEEFPVSVLITAGGTAFVKDDKFTFMTYAASYYGSSSGKISRG